MTCRDEILACANQVVQRKGVNEFCNDPQKLDHMLSESKMQK